MMHQRHAFQTRPRVASLLLALMLLGVGAVTSGHAPAVQADGPTITASAGESHVSVTGQGFTPGGLVNIWVVGDSGIVRGSKTVVASPDGPNGPDEVCEYSLLLGIEWCHLNLTPVLRGGRISAVISVCLNPTDVWVYADDVETGTQASLIVKGLYCIK